MGVRRQLCCRTRVSNYAWSRREKDRANDREAATRRTAVWLAERRSRRLQREPRAEIDPYRSVLDSGRRLHRAGAGRAALGQRGVVIRESGLVLTIGYLIMEAENVWLADAEGRVTPAHALAIDAETGFGLVQALGDLNCPALELGRSSEAKLGDPVTVAAGAGTKPVKAMIVGKQEFAGYSEYFLDEAIFTSPPIRSGGGPGAIDGNGRLIGVGSLHVEQLSERTGPRDINMIVPIDLLPPILDDLLTYGRVNKPARPWLACFRRKTAMK